MRTFKIIVITVLMLIGAGLILAAIYGVLPTQFGPSEDEFNEIYNDDPTEEEVDDVYSKQMKQFQGTVKLLGVSIYQEGTHRIEEDDKLIAILESEKINLPDFEGKEVRVRGFVRDTVEGGQKIMDVNYIEIVDEAGVRAFNEAGYEFSFSYPADWEVEKETDKVTFSREKNDESENMMIIYQFENVEQTLETWLKDRDQNLFYEEKEVRVGSLSGVQRIVKNGEQEIVKTYVKEGNNAYELRLLSQDEVIRNQYFSIVDFFKTSFDSLDEPFDSDESDEDLAEVDESDEASAEVDEEPVEEDVDPVADTESAEGEEEAEAADVSDKSFTDLEPLSEADIAHVLEKGFSPFEGRSLSFEYPKIWYFSYIGSGKYGFTDGQTYKEHGEEVTEEISRVFLIAGMVDISCSYETSRSVDGTTYTVCAREPGLSEIADTIVDSISK